MGTIILKVVEGRGKTGNAKTGKKRFLFTDDGLEKFNIFCNEYANKYKEKFPQGKQTYKTLREQLLDLVLKHQDTEIMDYEVNELNKILRVGNLTKLRRIPFVDIDKTLKNHKRPTF